MERMMGTTPGPALRNLFLSIDIRELEVFEMWQAGSSRLHETS
jgi:hypothetical protein